MAFTFIGASPNPLPLPDGLALDSRRFAGYTAVPQAQRPRAPSKLKVRYTITDPEGRIKNETVVLDPLPENCTVRDLQSLLHEHMSLSPRHPIVLRYHGEPLEVLGTGVKGEEHMDRPLAYYAIKDHSELTVVVKPAMSLAEARALAHPDGLLARVRIMSHKLSTALTIEELDAETKVGDLYGRIKEQLQASPIFLVAGPEPPVPIGARPTVPLVLAEPLPDGTAQLDARVGDQLVPPDGAGGKGKGGGNMKRISDGAIGAVAETVRSEAEAARTAHARARSRALPRPGPALSEPHYYY
jgi:hypothetical protein